MTEFIAGRYYWAQFSEHTKSWELSECSKYATGYLEAARPWWGNQYGPDPIRWVIIPSLEELLSAQVGERDELIIGRYYWIQCWKDESWQVGQWSETEHFDTAMFEQDHSHPDAIRWILIPSVEELLQEQRFEN